MSKQQDKVTTTDNKDVHDVVAQLLEIVHTTDVRGIMFITVDAAGAGKFNIVTEPGVTCAMNSVIDVAKQTIVDKLKAKFKGQ